MKHSRVLKGLIGWVLCAEDPDGKRIRLYTKEEHEWSIPDQGEFLNELETEGSRQWIQTDYNLLDEYWLGRPGVN